MDRFVTLWGSPVNRPPPAPNESTDTLPDGKTIKGIYKIDENTLTSSVAQAGKARPTEFASKPGTGRTLRVFKRAKP
jgi:hypothetical protein